MTGMISVSCGMQLVAIFSGEGYQPGGLHDRRADPRNAVLPRLPAATQPGAESGDRVASDAGFTPVSPRCNPPLVYYGTSIVHGAFTARSGLGSPQMLARELDLPLINLGFSGNARTETELAALFAELDAAMFLIDPLANMDAKLVKERAEPFLRILCGKRPDVPVFQIESPQPFGAWIKPGDVAAHREKIAGYRAAFSMLKGEGVENLHYIDASGFYGEDNDGSTDYVHPNALGHKRMSEGLLSAIRSV